MDLEIIRKEEKFECDIFRKATNTVTRKLQHDAPYLTIPISKGDRNTQEKYIQDTPLKVGKLEAGPFRY